MGVGSIESISNMIKIGDLVKLKHASIRDPAGTLLKLAEAPDYGIVIGHHPNHDQSETAFRVIWFDTEGGARTGEDATSMEAADNLEKISK